MRHAHALLPLALALVLAPGCRKDRDTRGPTVRILAPAAGNTFSIPDTIMVRVEVQDDRIVETVWIGLTDVDGVPVGPVVTASPGTSSAVVERALPVTDERLLSGSYIITVRASDGSHDSRDFRSVQVVEAPLRLRAVFAAPPGGTSPATVWKVDSTGVVTSFANQADVNGLVPDPAGQHVVVAGGATAPLRAIPTAGWAQPWQVSNPGAQGLPFFTALTRDPFDGRIYFATEEGLVRGFDRNGTQLYTSTVLSGFRCTSIAVLGDRLATVQEQIGTTERRLVVYPSVAGPAIVWYTLDLVPVGLVRRDADRVLVLGTRDGQGVVQERHIQFGGAQDLRVFPEGPVLAMCTLGTQDVALALPTGVVRYRWSTNTLTTLLPGVAASCLAHDPAGNRLYAAGGDQVIIANAVDGGLTGTIAMGQPIGSIAALTNR